MQFGASVRAAERAIAGVGKQRVAALREQQTPFLHIDGGAAQQIACVANDKVPHNRTPRRRHRVVAIAAARIKRWCAGVCGQQQAGGVVLALVAWRRTAGPAVAFARLTGGAARHDTGDGARGDASCLAQIHTLANDARWRPVAAEAPRPWQRRLQCPRRPHQVNEAKKSADAPSH